MARRRKIKPPTDLSYGLLELAARSVGVSLFGMMPVEDQVRAAKGLKKLQPKKRK